MKKIFYTFVRDSISSTRDALALYIIIMPIILAALIALFAPGLNDTTIKLAMLETDDAEHIEFMKDYAKVETFGSVEALETRVLKRDEIAGIVPKGDGYEIVLQGNESELTEGYATMLNAFYELDYSKEETTAELMSFGRTVPPVKKMLTLMLISMVVILSGMLIAMNIVDEKASNTVNAINVTPISHTGFILGKSMMGGISSLIGIVAALLITGFTDINWIMILLVGVTSLILSILVGFLQGIASEDIIEAAAGVKMLFMPVAGSIVGYHLLADNWQWTMYWSPFYWAYKANDMILSNTADWPTVLLCTGMVLGLSMVVYFIAMPKIRKGLS